MRSCPTRHEDTSGEPIVRQGGMMVTPRVRAVPVTLIVLIGSLIAPTSARAQLNAGRIVGTVSDPSHATVPQATVVATDTATSLSVTVTTNERGDYVVTPLNPGVYRVTVTLDGFQTAAVEAVEVQVGQSA